MEKFSTLTAVALPLDMANVDTDQIMPTRFMSRARKEGFSQQLLYNLRFDAQGQAKPGLLFDDAAYAGSAILIAGDNFGSGSSRESAVWALADYGLRAIVAPGFGDMFINNCFKNGVLPVKQAQADVTLLLDYFTTNPGATMTIDLSKQTVTAMADFSRHFDINPFRKLLLQEGTDDIDFTLRQEEAIAHFEKNYERELPWTTLK
jgi:3-isopropylmalate/(R)-2-methylmalate dehydratase small subunit